MVYGTDNSKRRIIRVAAFFLWPLFLAMTVGAVHSVLSKPAWTTAVVWIAFVTVPALVVFAQSYLLLAEHHNLDIETDDQGISYLREGVKVGVVPWSSIGRMRVSDVKTCVELGDRNGACLFRLSFLKDRFPELYAEVYQNIAPEAVDIGRDRYGSAWHALVLRYSLPPVFGLLLWGAVTYGSWINLVLLVIVGIAALWELAGSVSAVELDQNSMRIKFPFRLIVVGFDEIEVVSMAIDTSAGRHGVDTAFALTIQTNRFPEPFRLKGLDADLHQVHANICGRVGYDRIHHSSQVGKG